MKKKPKNISEEETLQIINNVINRIAPKYAFSGYEIDDMKQEAFLICADALERYDNKRPLENFLSVNLSNRLKNFVRDNHGTTAHEKRKVNCPTQLNETINCPTYSSTLSEDIVEGQEIIEMIEDKIPCKMREDYLRFMHGAPLSKQKQDNLIEKIKEIIDEEG